MKRIERAIVEMKNFQKLLDQGFEIKISTHTKIFRNWIEDCESPNSNLNDSESLTAELGLTR